MQKEEILVNGYVYPSIEPEVYEAWLPNLTLVSTFSYGITPEGGLIPLDDESLVEAARNEGVGALMVLTPLDANGAFNNDLAKELLENPTARTNLVNNILMNLRQKDMYGVDFDFEYVYEENKEQYVALVEEARVLLNEEGYLVTVALAPKISADQQGLLYQGHDYPGLGAAANFALLMTYEWGYTYGPPMAVAPIDQVRRVLDYGVSEIPADKILMGIPNYGYDWTLPYIRGESRAEKITIEEALARAERYGVAVEFDTTAMSPYYYYYDEQGRQHVVWFEDERSFRAKFQLVEDYGLAGISFWNIMSYYPPGVVTMNEMFDIARAE